MHSPLLVFTAEYVCSLGRAVHKEVRDGHVLNHVEVAASWAWENAVLALVAAWPRRGACVYLYTSGRRNNPPVSVSPFEIVLAFIALRFKLVVTDGRVKRHTSINWDPPPFTFSGYFG